MFTARLWFFTAPCWVLALVWFGKAISILRGMNTLPDLNALSSDSLDRDPAAGPHLTVIVPACNEEATIAATLRSLLASTGASLQIIAVNDRSTDATGVLMNQIAAEVRATGPHSLEVLHNRELPPGWLGKPHAMHLAAQRACAPWLLFTDADALFAPQALSRSLTCALAHAADHFVLVPTLKSHSIAESAMMAAVHACTQWATRFWKVQDPATRDFLGLGGFNMIRTPSFHALGGMHPLRMEVIEDMSLGWLAKHSGCRSVVAVGLDLVTIRWIQGPFGIIRNIEKNGFSLFRYRLWLSVLACLALLLDIVLPLAAILAGGPSILAGVLFYASIALILHANRRMNSISPAAAVLFAPCAAILVVALARSAFLALRRNGILWRGVHYPLSALRALAASWR
ncbi:glycosyltransferase [Acidobacteria bacterium AB60]|nr:glycosyltransferase [Acidobacteria bacterium AB60]